MEDKKIMVISIIIFVLSVIIAHAITSRFTYFGTLQGIIISKIMVWVVVFFALLFIADSLHLTDSIKSKDDAKESHQVSQSVLEDTVTEDSQNQDDIANSDQEDSSDDAEYDDSEYGETEESDNSDEYLLPDSAERKLTKADLKGLSKKQLRIGRNEIYARHGRKFKDSELQSYFDSKQWYEGTTDPDDFSEDVLSPIEKKNAAFIQKFE